MKKLYKLQDYKHGNIKDLEFKFTLTRIGGNYYGN